MGMDFLATIVGRQGIESRMRSKAAEALEMSDLTEVLELAGATPGNGEANAALKAIIAERIAHYAIRAMKIAKKKKIKLSAAAFVIAAHKQI